MLVFGIETTCDETSCAIVKNGRDILSNVIASQIDLHAEYGGVVPELSCRRHVDVLISVLQQALQKAALSLSDIDLFAVAHGPGLIGPLLIGVTAAKALALAENKPFLGINHIEAHLYAAIMSHQHPLLFPCLGAVLSGGHTSLVLMKDIGSYQKIGETVDDAIGEAFDKVAKLLNLPYPGGPQIEALALKGNPGRFDFKPGRVKGNPLNFSFSGLKTALLYAAKGQKPMDQCEATLTQQNKEDLAWAFQETAFMDVINKIILAAQMHNCQTIIFGGGVTNNQELRRLMKQQAPHLQAIWPAIGLSLDNAAMIAGLGYHHFLKRGVGDGFDLEACTRISF